MRLLEVRKKLDSLLSGSTIAIEVDARYNGYAQAILNSNELFTVLKFLSEQSWNNLDFTPIQELITKYGALSALQITVDQSEYNQLSAYVNQLNQQLPIFIGIVDAVIDEQSPRDINIKLSEKIKTPKQLNELTSQITELEKFANIDGKGLTFVGFDKGSEWIVVSTATSVAYGFIMACLKLAQEILKTKEQFFKTEEAKLSYSAALKKGEKFTDAGFKAYQESYSHAQLEAGAQKIREQLGSVNGTPESEMEQKATKTTGTLIHIIGNGNEVHLSLNAPKEISESADGLVDVDYSYLADLAKAGETKQLKVGKNTDGEDKKEAVKP